MYFILLWLVSGHILYIHSLIRHHCVIKDYYNIDLFVFITILGPLITLFEKDYD
jgi:hypothetical protein